MTSREIIDWCLGRLHLRRKVDSLSNLISLREQQLIKAAEIRRKDLQKIKSLEQKSRELEEEIDLLSKISDI